MGKSVEACHIGYFRDVVLAFHDEGGGTIELIGLEEDAWILSCESLDLVVELCAGDVHQFRYLVDIQFRVG